MSRRIYTKAHQRVIIESIGKPLPDQDIWSCTTVLEKEAEVRAILFTEQVKELLARLELTGWKKESPGEKESDA
jgi:hypothetical protein